MQSSSLTVNSLALLIFNAHNSIVFHKSVRCTRFIQQTHLLFFKWAHTRTRTSKHMPAKRMRAWYMFGKSLGLCTHAKYYTHIYEILQVGLLLMMIQCICSAIQRHCNHIYSIVFIYYVAPYLTLENDLKRNACWDLFFLIPWPA